MALPLSNTFRNVIHAFTDFLTVATHTILHERDIYPKTSFASVRKYNIAVRQNRHPRVCEWINDAVSAVEAQLLKGAVERVAVVIYSKSNEALERYVFDVSQLPTIADADLDVAMVRNDINEEFATLLPVVDMDEQFRAIMNAVANSSSMLSKLPKRCTFTIAIELRNDGNHHAPLSHPQAWVPALNGPAMSSDSSKRSEEQQPETTPLRTMRAGELKFEAWVEESASKNTVQAPHVVPSGSDNSKITSAET